MPLVGSECFFDGFGFTDKKYRQRFRWMAKSDIDKRETKYPPKRPLLPYLESVAKGRFPKQWDHRAGKLVDNDDWLLMEQALKE